MPDITVKNIPDSLFKKLAKDRQRSMNCEIIACLERSVETVRDKPDEILSQARLIREKIQGRLSADEIQAAIDRGRT